MAKGNDIKNTIKNLAKKANMSTDDLNKIHEEIKHDLLERGAPDDDKLEDRILGKMQGRLKKRFVSTARLAPVEGIIFGRSNAIDRAVIHHKITEKYIEEYGEDAAKDDGYLNDKGEHLYVLNEDEPKVEINGRKKGRMVFDNQEGKVIPEHDWEADGYGIMNYKGAKGEDKDDVRFTDFKLRGDTAVEPIPMMKESTMNIFMKKKNDKTRFEATLSNVPIPTTGEYIKDFDNFVNFIKKAYPDRVVGQLKNIRKVAEDLAEDNVWNPWLLVQGNIVDVIPTQKGGISLRLDDISLTCESDEDDIETIFVVFPRDSELDLQNDAQGAYFLVNPSITQDGDLLLFGLGYWVEEFERADKENVEETPDVQDPWG